MQATGIWDIWLTDGVPGERCRHHAHPDVDLFAGTVHRAVSLFFRAAKKQSIEYLPVATKALREGNYSSPSRPPSGYNKSHLAKVPRGRAAAVHVRGNRRCRAHDAVESVRLAVSAPRLSPRPR